MKPFILILLFMVFLTSILASNQTCNWENSLKLMINQSPNNTNRTGCLSDETCCFFTVKYSKTLGEFNASSCVPIDYDKVNKTYTYPSWRELSPNFCNDFKILATNKSEIDSVIDCECGLEYKKRMSSGDVRATTMLSVLFLFLLSLLAFSS